jgi:hypothetical protein
MNKQTIEVEVEVPDGYEAVGYRPPKKGELYIHEKLSSAHEKLSSAHEAKFDADCHRIIVRKVQKWRPARVNDLGAAEPLVARFRNTEASYWGNGLLVKAYVTIGLQTRWIDCGGVMWNQCEVLEN